MVTLVPPDRHMRGVRTYGRARRGRVGGDDGRRGAVAANGTRGSGERRPPGGGLPLAEAPLERADAARNREKILRVAAGILDEHGPEGLSVAEVARAAGTGVGTLYRRFGDRTGLILALLDAPERRFQESFMFGPPPLGPGAEPAERLRTFAHALLDRVAEQRELLVLVEKGSRTDRFDSSPYAVYHSHLTTLLQAVRPGAEPAFVADALLAVLAPSQLEHQLTTRGRTLDQVRAGLDVLLDSLLAGRS